MGLLAVSRIVKQDGVYKLLQEGDSEKCLKICEFLSPQIDWNTATCGERDGHEYSCALHQKNIYNH